MPGPQERDCNATVVGSISTRGNELLKIRQQWRTECLNTRFPLRTLLCAEYGDIS